MRLESTFDHCNFSSYASFTGPFVSAKLSLFAKLCRESRLALLAKTPLVMKIMTFSCKEAVSFILDVIQEV